MQGDSCLLLPSPFPELKKGTQDNASMQCFSQIPRAQEDHAAQHPHLKDQETELRRGEDQAKVKPVTEPSVLTPNPVFHLPHHTALCRVGLRGGKNLRNEVHSSPPLKALTDFYLQLTVQKTKRVSTSVKTNQAQGARDIQRRVSFYLKSLVKIVCKDTSRNWFNSFQQTIL